MADLKFTVDRIYLPSGPIQYPTATQGGVEEQGEPHQFPPKEVIEAAVQEEGRDEENVYEEYGGEDEQGQQQEEEAIRRLSFMSISSTEEEVRPPPSKLPAPDKLPGSDVSLNDAFTKEEMEEYPEQIVSSIIDQEILKPLTQALVYDASGYDTDNIFGEILIDEKGKEYDTYPHWQDDKFEDPDYKIAECRRVKTHHLSSKFVDVESLYLQGVPPDIPVTVREAKTRQHYFLDVPLKGDERLSGKYLRSLPRSKVLFAAAPEGFGGGAKYSIETRYSLVLMFSTAIVKTTLNGYALVSSSPLLFPSLSNTYHDSPVFLLPSRLEDT
jgi:hypothetical protein